MNPSLLITGGSRGIGAATAVLAARRGWDVAINYTRDADAAERVAAQVRAVGRRALVIQADVAEEPEVLAMFAAVDREFGRLSGLVNNAGVVDMPAARSSTCRRLRRSWARRASTWTTPPARPAST